MNNLITPRRPGVIFFLCLQFFLVGAMTTIAASNKNVWIEAPVYTREGDSNMVVCLGSTVGFEAKTGWTNGLTWSWSGATMTSAATDHPSYAEKTYNTAGGPFNVTATYKGETSFAARIKVLEVAAASASGATEVDDGDGNANTRMYYVCQGSGSVAVTATCNPAMTEQQLQGTCWTTSDTSGGSTGSLNLTRSVSKTSCGTVTITFQAGNSVKTVTVNVVTPSISSPANSPATANNFSFDKSTPGQCSIPATGSSCVAAEDPRLTWTLEALSGSTIMSSPSPATGPSVTFAYISLPAATAYFGNKTLTLNHPAGCSANRVVQIFFNGDDDAMNHPGSGSGSIPNWFYYWRQSSAKYNYPEPQYWVNPPAPMIDYYGFTVYETGAWRPRILRGGNDAYTVTDGPLAGTTLSGIDLYAFTSRHEARHANIMNVWYPTGNHPNATVDADNDVLPDAQESSLGGTSQNPINGGPFASGDDDTDNDGEFDGHDYIFATQSPWTPGSANGSDWSHNGKQSNQ